MKATWVGGGTEGTGTGLNANYIVVGDNFNPEIGLVRRRQLPPLLVHSARFTPRPQSIEWIRQFGLLGRL